MRYTAAEVRRVLSGYGNLLAGIADARGAVIEEMQAEEQQYREEQLSAAVYMSGYAVPDVPPSLTNAASDPTYRKARRELRVQERHEAYT